ncbi:MAG TPA: magnesium/cobalt transporter CorA [Burkholderiales bacterium]|nr:magnesium/cobalt transporter CorA [Burkholderiales bacterium]
MAQPLKRSNKAGLPPGSLVYLGEAGAGRPVVTLIEYDADNYREEQLASAAQISATSGKTLWLDVHGLNEPQLLEEIGKRFSLHPLVLEDILNTDQRPKVEDYSAYLFFVAKIFEYNATNQAITTDQVSIVLGQGFVLTFQEKPTGTFTSLRERLKNSKGQIRKQGADYIAYSLLDAIVDRYFASLEALAEKAEALEGEVVARPTQKLLRELHGIRRQTLFLRRAVWPLREVVSSLARGESTLFNRDTLPFLRDVYDHTVYVIESLDAIRDLIAGLMDIFVTSLSNRINLQIRLLTVITTIFMPLTLLTGISGMNFKHMPFLEWEGGFYLLMGFMLAITLGLLIVFWRIRWLR